MNVYETILGNYKQNKLTSYGEIVEYVEGYSPETVSYYFMDIDEIFKNNKMPPFSSLIINAKKNRPGYGYFSYHFPEIYTKWLKEKDNDMLDSIWWKQIELFNIKKAEEIIKQFVN